MVFHKRKTHKAACGSLALEAALVGGCFSLDLGQLIAVESKKYENLPISSKQHMIVSHQQ